jgi:hypothetical protein
MAPNGFSGLQKAKNADNFIYTKYSYTQSPDLYVSTDLKKETKAKRYKPAASRIQLGYCRTGTMDNTKRLSFKRHLIQARKFRSG